MGFSEEEAPPHYFQLLIGGTYKYRVFFSIILRLLLGFCIYQYLIHPVPSSKVDIPAPIFSTFDWKHLSIWGFLLLFLATVWEFLHTSLSNSAIPHFWGGSPAPLFSTFSCPKYNFTSNKLGFKCTASVHVWVILKTLFKIVHKEWEMFKYCSKLKLLGSIQDVGYHFWPDRCIRDPPGGVQST